MLAFELVVMREVSKSNLCFEIMTPLRVKRRPTERAEALAQRTSEKDLCPRCVQIS